MSESNPHDGAAPAEHPQWIGRYRIIKVLDQGSASLVYFAHDEQLDRCVVVTVLDGRPISGELKIMLAGVSPICDLAHPNILPVYETDYIDDVRCYVVSKYIEGASLATKLKVGRLKYGEAAQLVATIAEALHYAHMRAIAHGSVNPENILIGNDGQPYLVDFGSARKGQQYDGTLAYMSPEQARGEWHRVDARSDIFSLGVVFYELLCGRLPCRGGTPAELFEQVTSYEAAPLRQYDDNIPKELERICHKAIAKRVSQRYPSAKDFRGDLRHFLAE